MINIVDVEGLDAFGKSTFLKKFVDDVKKIIPANIQVVYQHFPNYCSETGQEILHLLQTGDDLFSENAIRHMIELQMRNRLEWWISSWDQLNAGYDQTVVIADRFTASNAIYQCSRLPDPLAEIVYYRTMEYERFHTVIPSYNIFCTCDEELQKKRLQKRKVKDQYESMKQQRFLRENYQKLLLEFVEYKKYTWLPFDLLDGEYLQEHIFQTWTTKTIAEEMYKIFFYKVCCLLNTNVMKKGRIPLKAISYDRNLYQWFKDYMITYLEEIKQVDAL